MSTRRRAFWPTISAVGLGAAAGVTGWLSLERVIRPGRTGGVLAPGATPESDVAGVIVTPGSEPSPVTLSAGKTTVRVGEVYTVTGAGWTPGAPVTLAVVKAERNVVTVLRGVAGDQGQFTFTHALSEVGTWEHAAHWQPDPADPPRAPRATTQVVCVA